MLIYLKCAINSTRTRAFSNTSTTSTYWSTKKASMKIVEISKECTSSVNAERLDTNSCSLWSNMNWFTSLKIRKSLTWRSRSKSTRIRFDSRSTFEFSTYKSTRDWNEIHTCEKFKKKWRNKSWFSRNCRRSFEKSFFAKLEFCTFSLFVWFWFMRSSSDTRSRIKDRERSINSRSYKIVVYEAYSKSFASLRWRFWRQKFMLLL